MHESIHCGFVFLRKILHDLPLTNILFNLWAYAKYLGSVFKSKGSCSSKVTSWIGNEKEYFSFIIILSLF